MSHHRDNRKQIHAWLDQELVDEIDERHENRTQFIEEACRKKLKATDPSEIQEELQRVQERKQKLREEVDKLEQKEQQYQQKLNEVEDRQDTLTERVDDVLQAWREANPKPEAVLDPGNKQLQSVADDVGVSVDKVINDILDSYSVDDVDEIPRSWETSGGDA